jgi:hypothetical protein
VAAATAQSKLSSQQERSTRGARLVALLALALGFALLAPSTAAAIPREASLNLGMSWINAEVPYSQVRYYAGYRTDCSGFVSMCWQTGASYNTRTLYKISYPIAVSELRPGDALLKAGTHVRLFAGWVDQTRTRYVAYEETGPGAVQTIKYIDSDLGSGYIPYRYNGISDGPPSWNLLANPVFDVWSGDNPVWWTASRDASGTVSRRSRDVTQGPRFALGVVNRSTDPNNVAEVHQDVPVEPNRTYTLTVGAWTNRDSRSVRMRLQFFDAGGATLVDTATAGDVAGIWYGGFRPMSMTCVSPPTAASAIVTFRLAGGSYVATDTPGLAVFDDVALYVSSPITVYRFYRPGSGTHFYTASGPERDTVIRNLWPVYGYEGQAYTVGTSGANAQNLYRFYNVRNGTHFYTASDAERDNVIRTLGSIYRYEGVAYRVSAGPSPGASAVFRFYNVRAGTHFYTASAAERDNVIGTLGSLYRYEGVAFHVAP